MTWRPFRSSSSAYTGSALPDGTTASQARIVPFVRFVKVISERKTSVPTTTGTIAFEVLDGASFLTIETKEPSPLTLSFRTP